MFVAWDGQRNTPFQVTRDGSWLETVLDEVADEVLHVRSPVRLTIEVCQEPIGEGRQIEEEMLGLARNRALTAQTAAWLDEIDRIECPPAVIALVTASVRIATIGARTLDIAVRQETPVVLAVELDLGLREDVAALVERSKDVLGDPEVIGSVRVREQVERDAELLVRLEEPTMIPLEDILRRHPFTLGCDGDRCAMRIAAADHEHAIAAKPVIACERIGRNVDPSDVPQMEVSVGVRPSDEHTDRFRHRTLLLLLDNVPRFASRLKQIARLARAAHAETGRSILSMLDPDRQWERREPQDAASLSSAS
ncbi:hypothetical protein HRbin27_02058 [bacterium HR27]|nr:hypothetical protein HRbin27_02058 [bacterium HR27]